MNFVEIFRRYRNLYLGVLGICLATVWIFNMLAPQIFRGTAVISISPFLNLPVLSQDDGGIKAPTPDELALTFSKLLNVERLSAEFPDAPLASIYFQPIRRSTTTFGVEVEGTDPAKIILLLTQLPEIMNSSPYIQNFSKQVTTILSNERQYLEQISSASGALEKYLLDKLASQRFDQLMHNPFSALNDVRDLRQRREMISYALESLESGPITHFDRPVVSQKPIRPRKTLNFIFWPFLALLITTLWLSIVSKRHEA